MNELPFQLAKDVSVQVITVASALLTISVAFIKDFDARAVGALKVSWFFLALSILGGVLALMAITGQAGQVAAQATPKFTAFETSVRIYAACQLISFFVAMACLAAFGISQRSIAVRAKAAAP
jgi:hypothetical protein